MRTRQPLECIWVSLLQEDVIEVGIEGEVEMIEIIGGEALHHIEEGVLHHIEGGGIIGAGAGVSVQGGGNIVQEDIKIYFWNMTGSQIFQYLNWCEEDINYLK